MSINRLGIVGCGITGVITAMLLKQRLPQIQVVILEKSRATGGRMCTSRNSKGYTVDLGAQFITKTADLTSVQERCYLELINSGLIEPLHQTIEGLRSTPSTVSHFICPKGSGSIVKYFLQESGCETLFNHKVFKINSSNHKWLLHCDNGSSHEFDAVVLTLPIPQLLQLEGLSNYLQAYNEKLKGVEYCSRLALGLFYKDSNCFTSVNHSARFVPNNPVIRYYSIESKKRTVNSPAIVIHTTKDFGKSHIDKDVTMVQDIIMHEFHQLLPTLPKPLEIKFHKWRYSQVEKKFISNCLLLSNIPFLICGGDGFTFSTFEGCILSAENLVQNIVENCNKS